HAACSPRRHRATMAASVARVEASGAIARNLTQPGPGIQGRGYRRGVVERAVRQLGASLRALVAVFGNPDLRRLEVGWAGMSLATWAFAIALGVYAFDIGGPTAVGIVALVRILPGAFAAPFAGLLGDRRSRRIVLVASA